jgi:hypothetical protein
MAGKKGKILVEADYDNIILVDPNKVVIGQDIVDRLVDHEDLVFYANLETRVIPRTKLAVGEGFGSPVTNTLIASIQGEADPFDKINFLQPKGKKADNQGQTTRFFDTSWSDQITGKGSRRGGGLNQTSQSYQQIDGSIRRIRNVSNYNDSQMFGIKSIDIELTPNAGPGGFIPSATIRMVDVGGRTLFEQGENSIYSVFFNQPYPLFYLTIKGYYGKAIRYSLYQSDFQCSFDSGSGNYEVTIKLVSNLMSLLFDTLVNYAKTAPKMFPTIVKTLQQTNNNPSNGVNSSSQANNKQVTIGEQKLNEVYEIYESKGLVEKNFPRMTIESFMMRCDTYITDIEKEIVNGDFTVFNDLQSFQENLQELRSNSYDEIVSTFLDTENYVVVDTKIYYQFKPNIGFGVRDDLKNAIKAETRSAVANLQNNPTFGLTGEYKLAGQTFTNQKIPVNFPEDEVFFDYDFQNLTTKNYEETYIKRYNKTPTQAELATFKTTLSSQLKAISLRIDPSTGNIIQDKATLFYYGETTNVNQKYEKNSFLWKIYDIQGKLDAKKQDIENKFTDYLSDRLINGKSGKGGLGFVPTIRNIFAVLIAGCDTFYRLMEDTHTLAWNKRNDPQRILSIIPPDKNFTIDSKNVINYGDNTLNDQNVVYPWPTYLVQRKDKENRDIYNYEYLGDPNNESKTNAFDYNVWPEVYFTENYLDAAVQKNTLATLSNYNNPASLSDFASCNAIEFPFNNRPYETTAELPFFYEMYERAKLLTHYSGFFAHPSIDIKVTQVDKFLSDLEATNIKEATSNNPFIQDKLRNLTFNLTSFTQTLKAISNNGTGTSWLNFECGNYVTNIIENLVRNNYGFYNINNIDGASIALNNTSSLEANMKKFIEKPNPLNNFQVPIPFMFNSSDDTQDCFIFLDDKKTIARLNETEKIKNINLFNDYYSYMDQNSAFDALFDRTTGQKITTSIQLKTFYDNKDNTKITCIDSEYSTDIGEVGSRAISSLLNTPFFVNAIVDGVNKEKLGKLNPYAALGYLYLNSLPFQKLSSVFNRLENQTQLKTSSSIWSSFVKFGAIHRVPYAWLLKLGSVWYRYKTFINDGNDIFSAITTNFDYIKTYGGSSLYPNNPFKIKNYTGGTIDYEAFKTVIDPNDSTKTTDIINTGFYPFLINDVYYYFTKNELITNFSETEFEDLYLSNKLRVGKNTNATKILTAGNIPTNLKRSIFYNSFYTYSIFEKDIKFNKDETIYLMYPSNGGLDLNEGILRCIDSTGKLTKEIKDNKSFYNGSARPIWGLPNFGYYDIDNKLTKLFNNPENFLEFSEDKAETTTSYSRVETLIDIFGRDILDGFESLFLGFCNSTPSPKDVFPLVGDIFQATYTQPSTTPEVRNRKLSDQILSLLTLKGTDVVLTGDENTDGVALANASSKNIYNLVNDFIKDDCILKIGNPLNYNRKLYASFSTEPLYQIKKPITFNTYQKGTLPGDGYILGPNELLKSKTLNQENKKAWDTLLTNVGPFLKNTDYPNNIFSGSSIYTNTGSPITDFFIKMNIEFSENNVKTLAPLILSFAKQKILTKNQNYGKTEFTKFINDTLGRYYNGQSDFMKNLFLDLNAKLPAANIAPKAIRAKVSGNVNKLSVYNNLQTFNNRWIAGSDLSERTLFEDFLFLNTACVDVGDRIELNVEIVKNALKNSDSKSMADVIGQILEADGTSVLFALPAYVNYYGIQDQQKGLQPVNFDAADSIFNTFTEVNYLDSRQRFLIQYLGNKSENTGQKNNQQYAFNDDAYDLGDPANCSVRVPINLNTNFSRNNRVVAFNVDFGIRNQNMFQNITIDFASKKNTLATFLFNEQMANNVPGDTVGQQTQSLYSFYKSQSYTCSVSMLGCAMIQPTMYFNLRHVPLFYGPYYIHKVSHNISPGEFKTEFEGTRQPKYALPDPDRTTSFVRKSYLENFKDKILNTVIPGRFSATTATTFLDEGQVFPSIVRTSNENCRFVLNPDYYSVPFVSARTETIEYSSITTNLGVLTSKINLKIYIMTKILTESFNSIDDTGGGSRLTNSPNILCYNNNLTALTGRNKFPNKPSNEFTCVGNDLDAEPLFSFSDWKLSLKIEHDLSENYDQIITDLENLINTSDIRNNKTSAVTYTIIAERSAFIAKRNKDGLPINADVIKKYVEFNIANGVFSRDLVNGLIFNAEYVYDKYIPPCEVPFNISATSVTNTTAKIEWSEPGIPPTNGYQYYLTTDINFVPNALTTPTGTVAAGTLFVNLTSLTTTTTYLFWIRSKCSTTKFSIWNNIVFVTT